MAVVLPVVPLVIAGGAALAAATVAVAFAVPEVFGKREHNGVKLPGPIIGYDDNGQPLIRYDGRPPVGLWAGGTPGFVAKYGEDVWALLPGARGDEIPEQLRRGPVDNRGIDPYATAPETRKRGRGKKVLRFLGRVSEAAVNWVTAGGYNQAKAAYQDLRAEKNDTGESSANDGLEAGATDADVAEGAARSVGADEVADDIDTIEHQVQG